MTKYFKFVIVPNSVIYINVYITGLKQQNSPSVIHQCKASAEARWLTQGRQTFLT